MFFSYYGHSAFTIEISGKKILFDPFITSNPLAQAAGVKAAELEADYLLVSHGHWDHLEDAAAIAARTGATVISNFEVVTWLGKQGAEKNHPMNTGGKWKFDFGTVTLTQAIHSSSFPDGGYAGSAQGFLIQAEEGNIYYAGDTALFSDLKLIGEKAPIDAAILPIGDNFTMGLTDAIKAAKFLRTNTIIGVHFDTFGYIKIDHAQARAEAEAAGIKLILPEVGKKFEIR